jgi:Spy/CpxP family protein refolding chaperone
MVTMKVVKVLGPLMGVVLAASSPLAATAADQATSGYPGPGMMGRGGQGYGPGMMGGGYGPGMMGGYGPGYGMGPGMMGGGYGAGYGMGPGTMGGYGMGYGMGPGMMGGYGMGMGFGRMGGLWGLDLKDEQVDKIDKIREELYSKQRGLMQQMWEQQDKLRELYYADKPDRAAIDKAYAKLGELQRQAFDAHLDAEKKMEDVLTKEQRDQLRRGFRRWGMMGY